jgi:hypothetical protein
MPVPVFDFSIAYVESLDSFRGLEDIARQAGVKGVMVKLQDSGGNPVILPNISALRNGGMARLRQKGFSVGLWSCPRLAPEAAAQECSEIYGALGLGGVIFETEWEYKSDGGGIDVSRLLNPWRVARPKAFTACATEGGPPTTFNHAAAIATGCHLLPENYWRLNGNYDVRPSLERCKALGWPRERVHPTLTGVEGHAMSEAIIRAYRARGLWANGVALWRGDMLSADDYRLLGLADTLVRR